MSIVVLFITQLLNPLPGKLAPEKFVSLRLHLSKTAPSKLLPLKLSFDKLHKIKTEDIKSALLNEQLRKSKAFLSNLLPAFNL
jgi:hypothetical protein